MFGRRKQKELDAQITELVRVVRLQGEAHSAIMNQLGALHAKLGEGFEEVHKRISFNNRPKP